MHKPIVGRVFGYGHFVFESAAQEQGLREIRFVGDPDERGLTIQRVIQQAGLRGFDAGSAARFAALRPQRILRAESPRAPAAPADARRRDPGWDWLTDAQPRDERSPTPRRGLPRPAVRPRPHHAPRRSTCRY